MISVDRHPVVDAEDTGDDVALRVHRRFLGRQGALADEVGDQAVVVGELVEVADRIAVDPRVTHVGHGEQLVAVLVDHG